MPNLMVDALKSFVSSSSATSTLSEIKSDAENIKDTFMSGARTAQETYRNMRSGGFKKVTDWFFQRGDEFGMSSTLEDSDDDEFDAGFHFDDDSSGEEKSKVLDYDSMKGIAKGQVSAMYQIGGKQAEAAALTTSEIISNMNTRSSEILSSLGTINSSLTDISKKLDKLVELSSVQASSSYRSSSNELLNHSGRLTIGSVFNYAKNNIGEKAGFAKSMYDMFKMGIGMMSPGDVLGSVGNMAFGDKKIKSFGDRSINDIGGEIDEHVQNALNKGLTALLNRKEFQKIFGDKTKGTANKNYAQYIENQYTKDKALFDGMTRKTIIDVIPGYLRKITEAVTGQTWHISDYGTLTTEKADGFKSVARNILADGMDYRSIKRITKRQSDQEINTNDIQIAQNVLTSLYVGEALINGIKITDSNIFKNGGDPEINAHAANMIARKLGKSESYWTEVITMIMMELQSNWNSREKFTATINETVQRTDARAIDYAQTATDVSDIKEFDHEMVDDAIYERLNRIAANGGDNRSYQERIDAGEMTKADLPEGAKLSDRPSEEALKKAQLERLKQSEVVTELSTSFREASNQTVDYIASIFDILNRGINVYSVKRKSKYEKMRVKKASEVKSNTTSSIEIDDISPVDDPTPTSSQPSGFSGNPDKKPEEGGQQPNPSDGNPEELTTGQRLAAGMKGSASVVTGMLNPMKFASKIKSAVSNEFNALKEDASNLASSAIDNIGLITGRELLQRDIKNMDTSDADSAEDQKKANEILAAMQAAVADGNTNDDQAAISEMISGIKDPKMKARLQRVVDGTLKRSNNKTPAKSKIGTVLMWGFGLVKKYLSPIFGKAKTFLTSLGKKIIQPILDSLKSSFQKITSGAKNVKEGIFGRKEEVDENGNVIQTAQNGLIKDIGIAAKNVYNNFKNSETADNLKETGKSIKSIANSGTEIAKDKASDALEAAGKIKEKSEEPSLAKDLAGAAGNAIQNGFVKTAGTIGGTALTIGNELKDKFTNSSFGKGFMEAWQKEEEKEKKPETVADFATKAIKEIFSSPEGKGENGTETVFSTIIKTLVGISDAINQAIGDEKDPNVTDEENGIGKSTVEDSNENSDENSDEKNDDPSKTQNAIESNAKTENSGDTSTQSSEVSSGDSGGGGGIGFDLGKTFGGFTKILVGIGQAVLTVIASMEGFKALMNLGMDILKKSLAPLNKAFQAMYKALQPIVKTITKLLNQIVEYVVEIVQSVIQVIQPILEALEPIINSLLETLTPILELVTGLVNVLMIPLMAIMKVVVVPVLRAISNTLEVLLGIVQVGMGIIMTALGGILIAVGSIVKFLTGVDSIKETGDQMFDMGTSMVKSGAQSVASGIKKNVSLVSDTIKDVMGVNDKDKEEESSSKSNRKIDTTIHGSALDATYGSGDTPSQEVMDTYGGAGVSQKKYGNYLNMNNRGCGPVALSDAYARRTGSRVDAGQLATAMSSAGTYNTHAGTSVRGYIKSSKALGMNVTPGGVTVSSLRKATPNNPVTVLGSGADFTTRKGNNHYMNVVGSDAAGHAYVSNPMTGKIERKSINGVVTNSVLGLYGSGDENAPYKFSEDVQDALATLKNITGSLISLFTGGSSVEEALEKESESQEYEQKKIDTSDMTEEEQAEIDKRARELFEHDHGRYENESDAEYEKRYQKYKKKYWSMAATERVREKAEATAGGADDGVQSLINSTLGTDETPGFISKFSDSMYKAADKVEAGGLAQLLQSNGSSSSSEGAKYVSDNGAVLWTDQYSPKIRNNDASNWTRAASNDDYKLILAEFFQNTISPQIKMTGAFKKYLDPVDADAVGSRGAEHSGADFTIGGNPEIHATTSGVVVEADENDDHFGSYLKLKDIGGDYHIYAHMNGAPKYSVGDTVEGGDVIGNMGQSGPGDKTILTEGDKTYIQGGDHLHYEIRSSDDTTILNPFTFFKYKPGSSRGGSVTLNAEDAMIRAASEVFVKAAEHSDKNGKLYHNVSNATNIEFDDGFVIDKISPTHCTSMMGAVVKRMGYYTYPGSGYTDTYQGEDYMGGNVSLKWGVSSSKGKAKIYNKDGSVSDDWETGPASSTNWKPGDIMFTSTGNAHAHMPVFTSTNGVVLGFNGGADDSLANSIKLGEYYLSNGSVPTDVAYNDTGVINIDKDNCNRDHNVSNQIGAMAGPLSYYVRYVGGPVTFSNGPDDYSSEEWYSSADYFDGDDYDTMTAAGVNAANSTIASSDDTSGIPYTWSKKGSNYGSTRNKARNRLFDWYIPTGVAAADDAWKRAHSDYMTSYTYWIDGYPNGTTIFAYNFADTVAGKNALKYLKSHYNGPLPEKSSSGGNSSVITTPLITDSDINSYLDKIKSNGLWTSANKKTQSYFSKDKWNSNTTIAQKINLINGLYNQYGMKYSISRSSIETAIRNNVELWNSDPGSVNNGTNVINPGVNTSPSTTTTTTTVPGYYGPSASQLSTGIQQSHDNWTNSLAYGHVAGGGDSEVVFDDIPAVDFGGIETDPIDMGTQPIIVNRYQIPNSRDGFESQIGTILTNTYNVRSEKIEGILEDMLALMKEKNQRRKSKQMTGSTSSTSSSKSTGFSSDEIPKQVERLSVG